MSDDADLARQRSRDARRFQLCIEHVTENVIMPARIITQAIQDGKEAGMRKKLPRLAGLAGAMDKLRHGIEHGAEKAMQKIAGAEARSGHVFAKAGAHVEGIEQELREVDSQLDALDEVLGGNGGPLDGSEQS